MRCSCVRASKRASGGRLLDDLREPLHVERAQEGVRQHIERRQSAHRAVQELRLQFRKRPSDVRLRRPPTSGRPRRGDERFGALLQHLERGGRQVSARPPNHGPKPIERAERVGGSVAQRMDRSDVRRRLRGDRDGGGAQLVPRHAGAELDHPLHVRVERVPGGFLPVPVRSEQ